MFMGVAGIGLTIMTFNRYVFPHNIFSGSVLLLTLVACLFMNSREELKAAGHDDKTL